MVSLIKPHSRVVFLVIMGSQDQGYLKNQARHVANLQMANLSKCNGVQNCTCHNYFFFKSKFVLVGTEKTVNLLVSNLKCPLCSIPNPCMESNIPILLISTLTLKYTLNGMAYEDYQCSPY